MVPAGLPPFDADRLAFAPAGAEDVRMLPPCARKGTAHGPRVADFWSRFRQSRSPPSWETDAAGVLIHYFEDRDPRQFQERATRSFGWVAALPGLSACRLAPWMAPCGWWFNSIECRWRWAIWDSDRPPRRC